MQDEGRSARSLRAERDSRGQASTLLAEVDAQVSVEALRAQHAGVDISQEATYSDRLTREKAVSGPVTRARIISQREKLQFGGGSSGADARLLGLACDGARPR